MIFVRKLLAVHYLLKLSFQHHLGHQSSLIRYAIACTFATLFLSACTTDQIGLPDGTTATLDPDIQILGHSGAAHRVYEKNFDLTKANAAIWPRIRNGFAIPDIDNKMVTEREKRYLRYDTTFVKTIRHAERYLYYIVEEVEKRDMPMELVLLPYVESAYNPNAVSHANAAGMWQFIPSTGRNFKLEQDIFRDERRDVISSTNAALDYLQYLYGMFDDWHLALAAYNWGEGNILRAINANKRQNKPTDYLSLRLPNKTQNYIPILQALKNIIADPEKFNVKLPVIRNHPFFQTVAIEQDIDVPLVAELANITKEEFAALNPAINKPVVLAAITPQILLPWDNAEIFMTKLNTYEGKLSQWTVWKAPRTMSVAQVATETKTPERLLREVNNIPPAVSIKLGSTLLVQQVRPSNGNVKLTALQNASISFTTGIRRIPTPSKVAVSQANQNRVANASSSSRQSISRPHTASSQRNPTSSKKEVSR